MKPFADREPVDAELPRRLLLADVPLARLQELHDRDLPAPRDGAQDHAERRRRLALAVAGVDEHERLRGAQPVGSRVLGRRLAPVVGIGRHVISLAWIAGSSE